MHARRRLITALFVGAGALALPARSRGQDLRDFPYADSLTESLLAQGRWAALDSVGRRALRAGTDYPMLRRRLGTAAAERDCPARAIAHYGRALRENPLDTAARYGLVLAHLALGQREAATFHAGHLDPALRTALHLHRWAPLQAVVLEATGQSTTSVHRGNAGFGRVGLGSQLGPRLTLRQSVAYFGQTVYLPELPNRPSYVVRQWEYHALLTTQLSCRWQLRTGYNSLGTRFGTAHHPGYLASAAVAYAHPFATLVLGGYAGRLTDTTRLQLDVRVTAYPLGNFGLYTFGRGSVVRSGGHNFPNGQLGVGGRVRRWCWLEAFGSTGLVPVLAEADGAYLYNLLDPQLRRGGAGVYFALPHRLLARVYYTAERRRRAQSANATYGVYALTTALEWTW